MMSDPFVVGSLRLHDHDSKEKVFAHIATKICAFSITSLSVPS